MPRLPTTFRVANIPSSTPLAELKDALTSPMLIAERGAISIEATLAPSVTFGKDTALVTFSPQEPGYLEPLNKGADDVQVDTHLGDLSLDKMFYGLTQLYPTTPGARIEAE